MFLTDTNAHSRIDDTKRASTLTSHELLSARAIGLEPSRGVISRSENITPNNSYFTLDSRR